MDRKLSESDKCEYGDCENNATDMVYSRNLKKVVFCCEPCSEIVIEEGSPEYFESCKNCGCRQGVG